MKALEFIVIQDMTMNDTSLYADILLPACHWFETEDLRVRYYGNPYLLWNQKAIEPLYESKPDFDVMRLIAEEMGVGEYLPKTAEELVRYQIEHSETLPSRASRWPSWRRITAA